MQQRLQAPTHLQGSPDYWVTMGADAEEASVSDYNGHFSSIIRD